MFLEEVSSYLCVHVHASCSGNISLLIMLIEIACKECSSSIMWLFMKFAHFM